MPQARSAVQLSPEQFDALAAELATFPPASQRRGRDYAISGRVGAINPVDRGFAASVIGQEVYETFWFWDGSFWEPDCSCPVAPYCKHAFALATVAMAHSEPALSRSDARAHRNTPQQLASPAARGGRMASRQQRSPLERLLASGDFWTRYQYLQELIQPARARGLNPNSPLTDEILHDRDDDMLCWRLARALSHLPVEVFPRDLAIYRDRPDLAARYAARERDVLSSALVEWAGRQRRATERRLRLVVGLESVKGGRVCVTAEARLTSSRMRDEPRNQQQLQQLRSEARRNPAILTPEMLAIVEWAADLASARSSDVFFPRADLDHRRLSIAQLRSMLGRLVGSSQVMWDDSIDPALAGRAGVVAGQPLRLAAEPVSVLPTCTSHDGAAAIELACVWPDGRERLLRDVVHLRGELSESSVTTSYVLADGCFYAVLQEPPPQLLDQFADVGNLPVAPADRDAVLAPLISGFPHLNRVVAARTKYHRVQPVVALDLRDDDWLQARIYARSGSDWKPGNAVASNEAVFEYDPSGRWVRWTEEPGSDTEAAGLDGIPADAASATESVETATVAEDVGTARDGAPQEVWFELPHPDLVAPVLGWMTALDLRPGQKSRPGGAAPNWGDKQLGWWTRLTRRNIAIFAEVWEQRPSGIAFFGTGRVRRMLTGEARVRPKLKIEASGVDWFGVSAEWEAEGLQLTDEDLAALRNATTRFVKISSGWVRREVGDVQDAAAEVLADLGIEAGAGPQRLTVWQLAGAKAESLAALESFGADHETLETVQRLRREIRTFKGLREVPVPPGLDGEMRPYQHRGLDFLAYTSSLGIGAILADDMGLGKTLQALAWLLHLRQLSPEAGPSLVVCPASVVHNWEREAARFAPSLKVLLLTSGKTRHDLRRAIPDHDVVVTNYALLRRDVEAWREVSLNAAIFDEAQQIKNPDAAVTRAASALQAKHRLALTGTPLENRALDLFSIVDVVNPGYLGRRSRFQLRFDKPDAPPHTRTLLAAKLRPILLRRAKKEVAPELPERIEEQWDCEMTAAQRQMYVAEVRRSRAVIENLAGTRGGIAQNKIHILAALTRLRQICCHPRLAGAKNDAGSGKFESFFELLEPLLAEGHKVLVFSQFVECLKLLRDELTARGISHHMLTGQSVKRGAIVDAFQSDPEPCVFLVSLKAGGTGLNLTAASYVVLFDPWWNPAVEAQAIDRTHRIGQDRTVIAYRLITRGTIEEKIFQLQQRKAALVRDILGEDGFARALTREDLDYLFEET